MSPLAIGAAVIFGVWLIGSLCFVLRAPRLRATASRLNWFRTFCGWALFAEGRLPDQFVAYSLEYRDRGEGDPGPWIAGTASHHRHPAGFLLDPRRPPAEALLRAAQGLQEAIAADSGRGSIAELRTIENVLARHLEATHPPPAGSTREIRLVRRFGARRASLDTIVWSFAGHRG